MTPFMRLPLLILVGLLAAVAAPDDARAEIVVELVTIGPDSPLYTRFGHNLVRVRDTSSWQDDVYDYGVADFQRPGFLVEAALGRAKFWLRRSSTRIRFDDYASQDREIATQRLNLTDDQIAYLLEQLEWNLRPENIEYTYDHVADNCSTRIRNLLNDASGKAILKAAYGMEISRTYREDILAAGSGRLLALIAFDLGTGPRGEDRVSAWQLSFMPAQLRDVVAATENAAMGEGVSLVASQAVVHRRSAPSAVGGSVRIGRQVVVAIGAVLGVFFGFVGFTHWRTRRSLGWLSRLAGLVLLPTAALFGSLGLVLLPIAWFSKGTIWTGNQNAWLFFPLDLLFLGPAIRWVWTGRATLAAWTRIYIDLRFLMIVIGWTGVVASQDNWAFALAAALTLAGLRMQPLKDA